MLSAEMGRRRSHRRRLVNQDSEEEDSLGAGASRDEREESVASSVITTEEEDCFTQVRTQVEEELVRAHEAGRFNPHPDEDQVRHIRGGYARLLEEVRASKADLVKPESTRLVSLLNDANELLNNVHTTADATLDSRLMALTADLGAEKIGKLASGTVDFNANDLCALIRAALTRTAGAGGEGGDWGAVGQAACRYWRGVQTPDSFLGPISVEPKERKARARAAREPRAAAEPVVQPAILGADEAAHGAGAGVSETASYVIAVYQTLARVAPVPFYKFILDPSSFSKTVENMFYVSFLANDNRVRIEYDEQASDLLLHLLEEDTDEEESGGQTSWGRPKHQAIFSLTMRLWNELKQKYPLERPMIQV